MVELVVVGSVAFDTIETPFGRLEEGLGGSATFFSLAASHFTKVGLVAVVGEDFPERFTAMMTERGVDLSGFERKPGKTFRYVGEYGHDLNERSTLDTQLNVFADFAPDLPEPYRHAPFVFLANIDPVLQTRVLDQVQATRFSACDTMNYWIEGNLDALHQTLSRADGLLLNDSEARQLSGEWNILRAIEAIHRMGPGVVVVKRGEYGAVLSTGQRFFIAPAFPLAAVRDPTGAGDSFAGGFMGYLARRGIADEGTLRKAMILGSVMASFCVESFGIERLANLKPPEIRERARQFRDLLDLSPLDAML